MKSCCVAQDSFRRDNHESGIVGTFYQLAFLQRGDLPPPRSHRGLRSAKAGGSFCGAHGENATVSTVYQASGRPVTIQLKGNAKPH